QRNHCDRLFRDAGSAGGCHHGNAASDFGGDRKQAANSDLALGNVSDRSLSSDKTLTIVKDSSMNAASQSMRPSNLRGDLAGMEEALAEFANSGLPQGQPAKPRIAVLVPCFNEEAAVASVVANFRKALPTAAIYVYDNNSTDRTVAVAR